MLERWKRAVGGDRRRRRETALPSVERVQRYGVSDARGIQGDVLGDLSPPRRVLWAVVSLEAVSAEQLEGALGDLAESCQARGMDVHLVLRGVARIPAGPLTRAFVAVAGSDAWWFGNIGLQFSGRDVVLVVKAAPDADALDIIAWGDCDRASTVWDEAVAHLENQLGASLPEVPSGQTAWSYPIEPTARDADDPSP